MFTLPEELEHIIATESLPRCQDPTAIQSLLHKSMVTNPVSGLPEKMVFLFTSRTITETIYYKQARSRQKNQAESHIPGSFKTHFHTEGCHSSCGVGVGCGFLKKGARNFIALPIHSAVESTLDFWKVQPQV